MGREMRMGQDECYRVIVTRHFPAIEHTRYTYESVPGATWQRWVGEPITETLPEFTFTTVHGPYESLPVAKGRGITVGRQDTYDEYFYRRSPDSSTFKIQRSTLCWTDVPE